MGKQGRSVPEQTIKRIIKTREETDMTWEEIADAYGYTVRTLQRVWKQYKAEEIGR